MHLRHVGRCTPFGPTWAPLGGKEERENATFGPKEERGSAFSNLQLGGPLGLTLVHKGPRAKPLCPWLAPLPTSLISCACQACLACFPWI